MPVGGIPCPPKVAGVLCFNARLSVSACWGLLLIVILMACLVGFNARLSVSACWGRHPEKHLVQDCDGFNARLSVSACWGRALHVPPFISCSVSMLA